MFHKTTPKCHMFVNVNNLRELTHFKGLQSDRHSNLIIILS
jgi:hypothetical protein